MKPPVPKMPTYLIPKVCFNELWSKSDYEINVLLDLIM